MQRLRCATAQAPRAGDANDMPVGTQQSAEGSRSADVVIDDENVKVLLDASIQIRIVKRLPWIDATMCCL